MPPVKPAVWEARPPAEGGATAEGPIGDVLFIRQLPILLRRRSKWRSWLRSWMSPHGATLDVEGHQVVFFFPGYGRRLRDPAPALVERIVSGQITDIVDVGAGGALDPELARGDLVLSLQDVRSDQVEALYLPRRRSAVSAAQETAACLGRRLVFGRILTHDAILQSRRARVAAFERTGCQVVQMEHCWFLERLCRRLPPESRDRLYLTHLEVVADAVPIDEGPLASVRELGHGLTGCLLRNQQFLGPIKSEFLRSWLGRCGAPALGEGDVHL